MATSTSAAEQDGKHEGTFDADYGDKGPANFGEGPQAEYGDNGAGPNTQEGSQDWHARKQK